MNEAFVSLLKKPSKARYLGARKQLLQQVDLSSTTPAITQMVEAVREGEHELALATLRTGMPSLLLSLRAYRIACVAAREISDPDLEIYRLAYDSCLCGLKATGDGSSAKPFRAVYVSDEYELLDSIGIQVEKQSLVQRSFKTYDVVEAKSGRVFWFDVTHLVPAAKAKKPSRTSRDLVGAIPERVR